MRKISPDKSRVAGRKKMRGNKALKSKPIRNVRRHEAGDAVRWDRSSQQFISLILDAKTRCCKGLWHHIIKMSRAIAWRGAVRTLLAPPLLFFLVSPSLFLFINIILSRCSTSPVSAGVTLASPLLSDMGQLLAVCSFNPIRKWRKLTVLFGVGGRLWFWRSQRC